MRSRATINNSNTNDTTNVNNVSLNPLTNSNNSINSINNLSPSITNSGYRSVSSISSSNSLPTIDNTNTILPIYENDHKDIPVHSFTITNSNIPFLSRIFYYISSYIFLYLIIPFVNLFSICIPSIKQYYNIHTYPDRIRKRYISIFLIILSISIYIIYKLINPSVTYITDSLVYQYYIKDSVYTLSTCTALGYTSLASILPNINTKSTDKSLSSNKPLSDTLNTLLSPSSSTSSLIQHIVLTESNIGFAPITENWLRQWKYILSSPASNINDIQNTHLLVVGLDNIEYQRLQTSIKNLQPDPQIKFISTWTNPETSFASHAQGFFNSGYLAIVFHKWKLLADSLSIISSNKNKNILPGILLMDVDALPIRNPLKYIETLPYCDAYFATETAPARLFPSKNIWYPEPGISVSSNNYFGNIFSSSTSSNTVEGNNNYDTVKLPSINYINTGFMYLRTTPGAQKFVNAVVNKLSTIESSSSSSSSSSSTPMFDSDQAVANHILEVFHRNALANHEPIVTVPDIFSKPGRPTCAQYGNFTFYIFNPHFFQNGKHAWENNGLSTKINEIPFMRHYNYLGFSPDSKVAAMKTDGIWLLSKEEENKLSCSSLVSNED